jgi:hypothetical protein
VAEKGIFDHLLKDGDRGLIPGRSVFRVSVDPVAVSISLSC